MREMGGQAFCQMRSTVDRVKEIAAQVGWVGTKELKDRKFLSDLKDLFTEYNDMPFNDVCKYLEKWENTLKYYKADDLPHLFFIDDREPEHIERLKKKLNAITLLVRRPGDTTAETSNHADAEVFQYHYDCVIDNNGTVEDFKKDAKDFIDLLWSDKYNLLKEKVEE